MKPKSIKFVAMTVREAANKVTKELQPLYEENEAANIAQLVIEHVTSFDRSAQISKKDFLLSPADQQHISTILEDLLTQKPVQYVLGEAWFMGMKFHVDENVLIPRPETEELVYMILDDATFSSKTNIKVIDIGTGSGCIAISLKKLRPSFEVHAIDVSENALAVAKKNAKRNNAEIIFCKADVLDESQWSLLPDADIIVSNPPYIPLSDRSSMSDNVVQFEPHIALFTPDNDPLLFYKKIVQLSAEKLHVRGKMFFEIHEGAGDELKKVFATLQPEIRKDMQGKERMLILNSSKRYGQ